MKRLSLIIVAMLLGIVSLMACPGYSKPVNVMQPDGTTITLLMHGDEFRHFVTTIDGYTVAKNEDGYYCYAEKDCEGQLQATGMIAMNPAERDERELSFLTGRQKMVIPEMTAYQKEMKARSLQMRRDYASLTDGTRRNRAGGIWEVIDYSQFKGLLILVEFSDRTFTIADPQSFYQRLTSEKNLHDTSRQFFPVDVEGSARDYFFDNSLGAFDPTFDVVGPVQIDAKSTDMGGSKITLQGMSSILKKVLSQIDSKVDFSKYDLDNDGVIDMCYFIFAGFGSNYTGNNEKYLWPHADNYTEAARWMNMRYDNRYLGRYACSVEMQGWELASVGYRHLDGIGTICHEFSHVLGLADHYDTDYAESGTAPTAGGWDIMSGGSDFNYGLTPPGYNAFERYVLEFSTPREIDQEGKYSLNPFNSSNESFILRSGTDGEDFYIENRQKQGWDSFLPGHGMLVWRADLSDADVWRYNIVNVSPDNMHFELLKAVPGKDMESEYTPFPGKGSNTDLTTTTSPALISSKRTEAPFNLYDITESKDGIITFEAKKEQKYKTLTEDFEMMNVTTADANDVKGVFCNWNFKDAVVERLTGIYGHGEQAVMVKRNGSIESSVLPVTLHNLSFTIWSGGYQTRVTTRYKAAGDTSWTIIPSKNGKNTEVIDKNSSTILSYSNAIPKGSQFQILVQGVNAATVGHIDDITVSVKDEGTNIDAIESIQVAHRNNSQTYNLNGQKVGSHYRGITIRNGKKSILR